jgi:hypothetical protein
VAQGGSVRGRMALQCTLPKWLHRLAVTSRPLILRFSIQLGGKTWSVIWVGLGNGLRVQFA